MQLSHRAGILYTGYVMWVWLTAII